MPRSSSTASSICRMPTRCSRRSAFRPAPHRRRRRTTSSSCRSTNGMRSSTRRQTSAPTASVCSCTRGSIAANLASDPQTAFLHRHRRGPQFRGAGRRQRAPRQQSGDDPGHDPRGCPLRAHAVPVPRRARRGRRGAPHPCRGALGRRAATPRPVAAAPARGAPRVLMTMAAAEALAVGIAGSADRDRDRQARVAAPPRRPVGDLGRGRLACRHRARRHRALALAAVLAPAWWDARHLSVTAARSTVADERTPPWARGYLDLVLLALSAIVFWRTAHPATRSCLPRRASPRSPSTTRRFSRPLFFWLGMGLLALRLTRLAPRPRPRDMLAAGARTALGVAGAARRRRRWRGSRDGSRPASR